MQNNLTSLKTEREAWNLEIIVQQDNKGHTVYEFRKVRAGNNNYNNNLIFILRKIHVIYDQMWNGVKTREFPGNRF